jgi:hypothetical protein
MSKSLITLLLSVVSLVGISQGAPALISYQAVLRDGQGVLVANQEVTLEFAIRQGNIDGSIVFEESHPMVSTNLYGVFAVQIGSGIPTGVGTYLSLDEIPWSNPSYFVEVRAILPGQGVPTLIGVSQLLSVPYALHSATADSVINEADGSINNETINDITFDGVNLVFHEGSSDFSYNVTGLLALVSGDNDSENELVEQVTASDQTTLEITEAGNTFSVDMSPISYATWNETDTTVFNTTQRIGVGIDAPTSSFHNNGSHSVAFRVVEGDAETPGPTVDQCGVQDYLLLCDITEEDVTITLPDVSSCAGRVYRLRKYSTSPSSYDVNLVPISGQLIEGTNNWIMGWPLAEYVTILSTGVNWMIIEHSKE